jgi:guanylate kinase
LNKRGSLIVLSAPSGGGKSTVIKEILKRRPDFSYSISCTTRPIRHYEVEGVHYHYLTEDEFRRRIAGGRFLEWEEVHGNLYGTDREIIEAELAAGKNVLLDIDVNGGEALTQSFPDLLLIFLYPPSIEELRRRLKLRGSDDDESIERRLSRYSMEKEKGDAYPFRIVNDDLEKTIEAVLQLIEQHTAKYQG